MDPFNETDEQRAARLEADHVQETPEQRAARLDTEHTRPLDTRSLGNEPGETDAQREARHAGERVSGTRNEQVAAEAQIQRDRLAAEKADEPERKITTDSLGDAIRYLAEKSIPHNLGEFDSILHGEDPAAATPRFDPNTGERLNPPASGNRFDPNTGAPLN